MACHHGVEGPCIVCEAVVRKRANPAPVQIVQLHLQGDSESGASLCGLAFTDCLFSNLTSHDEERFCRRCLMADRKRKSIEKARARSLLPLKERLLSLTLWILGILWVTGIIIGVGVHRDWGSATAIVVALAVIGGIVRGSRRR